MPRLNQFLHDECGCRLDGPIFIYAGKAVKLRNRLMEYTGCRTFKPAPSWVDHFTVSPHQHLLKVAIWYVDRRLISMAEGSLIDRLKPMKNIKDRIGFGGLWSLRKPDAIANLEEVLPHLNRSKTDVWIEDRPGVYVWLIDPGDEVIGYGKMKNSLIPLLENPAFSRDRLKETIAFCEKVEVSYERRMERLGLVGIF